MSSNVTIFEFQKLIRMHLLESKEKFCEKLSTFCSVYGQENVSIEGREKERLDLVQELTKQCVSITACMLYHIVDTIVLPVGTLIETIILTQL